MNIDAIKADVKGALVASQGEACRLLHGRGKTYAGWEQVSIDFYKPFILVTVFTEPDMSVIKTLAQELLVWGTEQGVTSVVMQRRGDAGSGLEVLLGELPRKPYATEAGLQFGLQVDQRQNLGFFLDMRGARDWLRDHAAGKRVLNLFAYTCAFSVVARAAGARSVINLDMSSAALRLGQQNHQRNGIHDGVTYLGHNLFKSWSKLRRSGPYDLIIVDPPTRQPGSFVVEKDYPRVLGKLPVLCAPGAELLLCLNSPHLDTAYLKDIAADAAPQLEFVERLDNPPAFIDGDPESSLKVLRYRYA